MEGIIIKEIICEKNRVDIYFSVSNGLEKYFQPAHHFFAEYSCDISRVPESVLVVPLLSNILQFSWLFDCNVWVNEIDKTFYESISKIKVAFKEMYPEYSFRGSLIPAKIIDNEYAPCKKAVALFTGGVDATTTFFRIYNFDPILVNVNGWYEEEIRDNDVYNADKTEIEQFANNYGVVCSFVRSNFATFLRSKEIDKFLKRKIRNSWWRGFQHSLAFLGCAAVVGYVNQVEKMYIGSSHTFGEYAKLVSDPRIDNCFSVASMCTIHDGYEMSRQDKVRFVIQMQNKTNRRINLRVCSFNTHNCCKCEKCLRTMLAITAEGGDISCFGFDASISLLERVKLFLKTEITELDEAHIVFWYEIIKRMEENYKNVTDKDVLNYLSTFDFKKARKEYLFSYYIRNFWKILVRKLRMET